jgi:FAD/FMN-containing dehydrogenase
MTLATLSPPMLLPIDALRSLLKPENVITDGDDLRFYSTDVYRRADIDAVLVIRPETTEELSNAVRICTAAGFAVVARGGGLSYTGGFLPTRAGTVIVDMQRLDKIVEINPVDMYVTVECGASWRQLYEKLKPLGLRTPYFGPMSGYASTVGGALSQGSIFLGSTQFGTSAESVLGLDVVIADGLVVTTGSAGGTENPGPFFRNYGPDLTGLFLHDAGALGIKARATLKLISALKKRALSLSRSGSNPTCLPRCQKSGAVVSPPNAMVPIPISGGCVCGMTILRAMLSGLSASPHRAIA